MEYTPFIVKVFTGHFVDHKRKKFEGTEIDFSKSTRFHSFNGMRLPICFDYSACLHANSRHVYDRNSEQSLASI